MDTMVLVIMAIAACVALEFFGFRAYKRHKVKKESLFTKEQLAEVYDDLQDTRSFCLGAKNAYRDLATRAADSGSLCDAAILEAMAAGEEAHLKELESFRERLHAEPVDVAPMHGADKPLEDALRDMGKQVDEWASGPCADRAARARLRSYGDIARMYRRIQEVERLYAGLCLDVAEGAQDGLSDLSRCPGCGIIVSGRRPAFCTVCTQPGFEFKSVTTSG